MDFASIVGMIMGLLLCVYGIIGGEDGVAALEGFLHAPSAFITFGGAFFSVMAMQGSIPLFLSNLKSIGLIFKPVKSNEEETIQKIIELSNVARKDGLLALEEASQDIQDEFLKKGVMLIVDGTDPELVRSIMETELNCIEDRHKNVISFWENLASMGPAWGMIGTLIGLINMLGNMGDDINSVGPNMATALITTLYGSLLANWVATPTATKLKANNAVEIRIKEVMVEGLLSIQAGENPRVIEEKLKSFLSPARRSEMTPNAEGGEANG